MGEEPVLVPMAQTRLAVGAAKLKTILGSCVGVVLRDASAAVSGLAHIMLPARTREDGSVGKYADTAIPYLLSELVRRGARRENLEAWLAGGANMFRMSDDRRIATIGERNVTAARRILEELGVPIVQEETGGERGRTILFDTATGRLEVRTLR